ncbi:hypothetical protein [Rhizobium sp. TRM95796]|uniref:hypothetical protein n=1 Tax=Rhizobium sp. TRM95796 TaxID=2979862 RepID=UPI0021E7592F|nr:hypothetical protein [Rhizobium sp. TRM95796]MCV3764158.1 hypothetical protein [Rhizobium sp. TRM95796]
MVPELGAEEAALLVLRDVPVAAFAFCWFASIQLGSRFFACAGEAHFTMPRGMIPGDQEFV